MSDEPSAEQHARDMLDDIGVEDAQSYMAGELVELANLIAAVAAFKREDVNLLRVAMQVWPSIDGATAEHLDSLTERLDRLLRIRARV